MTYERIHPSPFTLGYIKLQEQNIYAQCFQMFKKLQLR